MGERIIRDGPYFEQFSIGKELEHPRTVTVHGDEFYHLVKTLGFNDQPIHYNYYYARSQGYMNIILPGPIVFALVFTLTRQEISWNGINLGAEHIRHNLPVYPGDTLRAHSVVLNVKE